MIPFAEYFLEMKGSDSMWFIKAEFSNEFQALINNYTDEAEIIKKIHSIKATEKFCKEGKGVSFYNRRVIDNKLLKEISKYKQDKDYCEYNLDKK